MTERVVALYDLGEELLERHAAPANGSLDEIRDRAVRLRLAEEDCDLRQELKRFAACGNGSRGNDGSIRTSRDQDRVDDVGSCRIPVNDCRARTRADERLDPLARLLPVSSSGHLVLLGDWLGMNHDGGLSREIALHLGTLVAVVIFCFADLRAMLTRDSAGLWRLMIGSTLVTGVLGILLKDTITEHLGTERGAGLGLLITSSLLIVVAPSHDDRQQRSLADGSARDAIVLGLFQTLALMPGVSRAGATIVGALLLGFRRPHAVRIAFLMSVPVVAGAILLDSLDREGPPAIFQDAMPAAMLVACVVGLVALRFVSVRVDARSLRRFGYYTLALGLTALSMSLIR